MNLKQAVIENLRRLPLEKQQEVLDFSQFLTQRPQQKIEEMTPHEKAEDWLKFLESQPKDTPGLPDEALSRETIYD
ncbi:MAG: hypothetical protein ACKPBV_00850 [Sphaerospermopsis kisseleviana]